MGSLLHSKSQLFSISWKESAVLYNLASIMAVFYYLAIIMAVFYYLARIMTVFYCLSRISCSLVPSKNQLFSNN